MERLPVELLDMIVHYLPLPDRQALRLVSKLLYSLTLAIFSTNYFSRRVTTLGAPSLKRLLKAASHPRFAASVTLLDVKLLNHEDFQNLKKIDRVGIFPPPKRLPKVPQIKMEDISQESRLLDYMHTHRDPKAVIDPLSRALKRFPNIRTLRLRVNGLTLYGNPYIDPDSEVFQRFAAACFKAVLDAIIRSGISLREFTLVKGNSIRPVSKSANLIYPAFNLPYPYLLSLRDAFSSLKSLRLSIRTNHNGDARVPGWENGVSQFISSAPALQDLTICLHARDSSPAFRAAVMHSIAHSVELIELKTLQLYGCVFDELDIVALVRTHAQTLRRLLVSDTELRTGTWASVLMSIRQVQLRYLRLQYLQQVPKPQSIQWNEDARNRNKLTIDVGKSGDRESMGMRLSQVIAILTAAMNEYEIAEA